MRRTSFGWSLAAAVVLVVSSATPRLHAQPTLTPDAAALQSLNAARRAFNEKNYPFAIEQFRQFIAQHGGHKEAPSAHFGLGLALLESPQKDYAAAAESLQRAAAAGGSPDRPLALYYLGAAQRGIGQKSLAEAAAKPNEAAAHRQAAKQRFEEAAKHFAAAADALRAKVSPPAAPDAAPSDDAEWAARARCDHAEMLLRAGKHKEANEAAEKVLGDARWGKSRYLPLALYHQGYARFGQKEYLAAGRALSRLAPFQQEFGPHARYLLARTHHLAGERPEAAAQYKAVAEGWEAQKKAAQQALQNPAALEPDRKAFFESLVNGPPPEYLLRTGFYTAVLMYEDGRFAEAAERFAAFGKEHATSDLAQEAQLRLGYCKLQLKAYPEAVQALTPLKDHPHLADQAQWWLARAQLGAADPSNAAAYTQAATAAAGALRAAADRANQMAAADPGAKARRAEILMDLADAQQQAKQHREAAGTYHQVIAENLNPDRAEEAMQRQATALHLAGAFAESDALCDKFEKAYPRSTLLPAILFRRAENAYLTATAAAKPATAEQELKRLFTPAVERYEAVVAKYPEFPHVNLARQGLGLSHYRLGQFPQAIAALTAIPDADRTGDLAAVPYLLADCLIRTFPPEAVDALAAAKLIDGAEKAAKLLEAFTAANEKSPYAADALLKLGHCYQRVGAVLADAGERKKLYTQAREAYDKAIQKYPGDPSHPTIVFERARCLAALGDASAAMIELRRFESDPLRASPNAPLALLRLSSLLRSQNKAQEAADVMSRCRQAHEGALANDASRKDWVPLLQYEHAVAYQEAKKLIEARALLEQTARAFAGKPEAANALWRLAQCRREELSEPLARVRAAVSKQNLKPEEFAAAYKPLEPFVQALTQAAQTLQAEADALAGTAAHSDAHLRMLFELAWCHRALAEVQADAARFALQQEALAQAREKLAKQVPAGESPPAWGLPDVPFAAVPPQPGETKAREYYQRVIGAAPDSTVANQARFDLAELHAARRENDAALELLAAALAGNPPPETAERIRLRMAACFLARDDARSALAQARAVAQNEKGPLAAEARYLVGESLIRQKEWPKAIEQLLPFRDQEPLRSIAGVSDRALLRLGHAYGQAGQWEESRRTLEALVGRYAQSRWVDEARYGMGLALQNMKRFDEAVNQYAEVTKRTAADVAARSQFQIGLCRMEQKRYPDAAKALLTVAYTYDYPDWTAPAWYEAGRALAEEKKEDEAEKWWRRVVREYPNSKWAPLAEQRLAELSPQASK